MSLPQQISSFLKLAEEKTTTQMRNWVKYDKLSQDEQVMMRKGIIPILSSENNSSFVGEGSYNKVYETIYNDTHTVTKVTTDKRELDIILKLNEIAEKEPIIRKHIPKVYDYFKSFSSKFPFAPEIIETHPKWIKTDERKYFIVVEYLVQPPLSLAAEYLNYRGETREDDKTFVHSVVKQKAKFLKSNTKQIENLIENVIQAEPTVNTMIKELTKATNISVKHLVHFWATTKTAKEIIDKAIEGHATLKYPSCSVSDPNFASWDCSYQLVDKFIKETKDYLKIKFHEDSLFGRFMKIVEAIWDYVMGANFPLDISNYEKDPKEFFAAKAEDPRIRSLITAAKLLQEKYSIVARDMAPRNIMMRPSTGDLVFADVGLFD